MKRHVWLLLLAVVGVLLSGCCDKKEEPMANGVEGEDGVELEALKTALLSIREAWGTDAPQEIQDSWTAENAVTDFYGVTVNGLGQISVLNLSDLNISSVPDMSVLTPLKSLNLNNNNLTQFPTWVCNMTNLEELHLSFNALSGGIPAEIFNMTNLVVLDMSVNALSGEIPAEIGNMTNLEYLSLSVNALSGEIPAEIGNLTNLVILDLGSNALTGEIPAEIFNMTNLVILDLYNNALTGEIPAEIGNLTNLETLVLYDNTLTGEIPTEIGSMMKLEYLYLYNNNLSGMIPDEVLEHPYFNNWALTPQNAGYGFDNYPVSSGMSKVRDLPVEKEAVLSARKAEIRERILHKNR